MKMFELVFIPSPGVGHLRSTVQMAKLLVRRDDRLSITVLIVPDPSGSTHGSAYITSLTTVTQDRLRYKAISVKDEPTGEAEPTQVYMEKQKPQVRDAIAGIIDPARPDSPRLAGLVVDMFCFSMIDVGNEFGVPTYMVYTSNAAFLGVMLHVQELYDEGKYDVNELEKSVVEIEFPCLTRPYPVMCLPYILKSKEWLPLFLAQARYFRKMKGILVNTVAELETHSLKILSNAGGPPIYPVGPVLHLGNDSSEDKQPEILQWLDEQPPSSVVFLCFGSMGAFNEEQIREIAAGLERNGHRFLWSLRRASSNLLIERPQDFTNLEEVLPKGFLDRTVDRGRVIGWAPQVAVLAKTAIGGFFTHCGWNSMLEGLWFGVPMATWPSYAEQQVNAFEMVEELGLAVAIKKHMRGDLLAGVMEMVTAEEIERAVRSVMEQDSDVRARVKEMAEKCHVAVLEGGSSSVAMQKFIQDLTENVV